MLEVLDAITQRTSYEDFLPNTRMKKPRKRSCACRNGAILLVSMLHLPSSSLAFAFTQNHQWHHHASSTAPLLFPPYDPIFSTTTASKKYRYQKSRGFQHHQTLWSTEEKAAWNSKTNSNVDHSMIRDGGNDDMLDSSNKLFNTTQDGMSDEDYGLVNLTAIATSDLGGSTRMGSPLKGLSFGSNFPSLSSLQNSTKRTYQYMTPNLGSNFASFSMDYLKNSTKLSIPKRTYRYTTPYPQKSLYSASTATTANLTLPPALNSSIQANDTLTLYELQEILKYNGYIRQEDLNAIQRTTISTRRQTTDNGEQVVESSMTQRRGSGVALPQPSVLNYKSLQRGTAIASAVYGMILSYTILPNLWLMGVLFGGLYGFEITSVKENLPAAPKNVVSNICISSGRKLAKVSLQLYDNWQGLWFLYKTGQLSYEYYKRYEVMDQRFGIQNKMDAWNTRFQEQKVKFDQWEKENEIGRTVLAGLRTVWLVDERAKLRAKQKSRYRVIQWVYNGKYYIQRQWTKVLLALKNNRSKVWNEFWTGVGQDMKSSGRDALGTRIGAIVASLVVINVTGALFAISPSLLTFVAALIGIVWPSWVPELVERLKLLAEETRARGRGEENFLPASSKSMNRAKLLGRYDKAKYHYYKRPDGSRQYYRTGQSYFRFQNSDNKNPQQGISWLWKRKNDERKQPSNLWGVFGGVGKGQNS